jgi:hypothetical protein
VLSFISKLIIWLRTNVKRLTSTLPYLWAVNSFLPTTVSRYPEEGRSIPQQLHRWGQAAGGRLCCRWAAYSWQSHDQTRLRIPKGEGVWPHHVHDQVGARSDLYAGLVRRDQVANNLPSRVEETSANFATRPNNNQETDLGGSCICYSSDGDEVQLHLGSGNFEFPALR